MAVYLIGARGQFDPRSPAVFTSSLEDLAYTHNISRQLYDHKEKLGAAHDEAYRADHYLNQYRAAPTNKYDPELLQIGLQEKLEAIIEKRYPEKPPEWRRDTVKIMMDTFSEAMGTPSESVTNILGDKNVNYLNDITELHKELRSKYSINLDDIVAVQTSDPRFDPTDVSSVCKAIRQFINEGGPQNSSIKLFNSTDLARISLPIMNTGYDNIVLRDQESEQQKRNNVAAQSTNRFGMVV